MNGQNISPEMQAFFQQQYFKQMAAYQQSQKQVQDSPMAEETKEPRPFAMPGATQANVADHAR
jgi:hypothetical protein